MEKERDKLHSQAPRGLRGLGRFAFAFAAARRSSFVHPEVVPELSERLSSRQTRGGGTSIMSAEGLVVLGARRMTFRVCRLLPEAQH